MNRGDGAADGAVDGAIETGIEAGIGAASGDDESDATVVVTRAEVDLDATVALTPAEMAAGDSTAESDETVVVGGAGSPPASRRARRELRAGEPVPEPVAEASARRARLETTGSGLDPEHRVAAAPDLAPWEVAPSAVPGVHQGLPVPYAPRSADGTGAPLAPDEVRRRLGQPPAAAPVRVRAGREALPSLAKRERRSRLITLIAYSAAVAVSVAGLVLVAALAFA